MDVFNPALVSFATSTLPITVGSVGRKLLLDVKGLPVGQYRVTVTVDDRFDPGTVSRTFVVRIARR